MYGATKTDVEDWAFASAGQMAKAIKSRSVSSRELTEAYLSRIVEHNSSLNAVVTVNEEEVLARASEADESVAQGAIWGPLHGVPSRWRTVTRPKGFAPPGAVFLR
jgi:amidase